MAVTDLPEPDSPTMANTSPRATSNDTPSTARTKPSSVVEAGPQVADRQQDVLAGEGGRR